jgi:hypothetical protein
MEQAAAAADVGLFLNGGQCCCASSRIYVEEGAYDAFCAEMVKRAEAKTVGDPNDPSSDQGPQVDKIQFDKILGYVYAIGLNHQRLIWSSVNPVKVENIFDAALWPDISSQARRKVHDASLAEPEAVTRVISYNRLCSQMSRTT